MSFLPWHNTFENAQNAEPRNGGFFPDSSMSYHRKNVSSVPYNRGL